jgi:hypothetical protein
MIRVLLALVVMTGTAAAGHCHETSPIVGRRHCGHFGTRWAHVWFTGFDAEGAIAFEHLTFGDLHDSGTLSSPTSTAGYHVALAPGIRHTMSALGPRFGYGLRTVHALIGVEATFTFAFDGPRSSLDVDGMDPRSSSTASVFDGVGLLGLHQRAGDFELSAVVAIGFRTLELPQSLPDGFTTCANGATGKSCGLSLVDNHWLVEPRLRADLWIYPQTTLALTAGYDVIERGESLGLSIMVHGVSFDGS